MDITIFGIRLKHFTCQKKNFLKSANSLFSSYFVSIFSSRKVRNFNKNDLKPLTWHKLVQTSAIWCDMVLCGVVWRVGPSAWHIALKSLLKHLKKRQNRILRKCYFFMIQFLIA